MLTLWRLESTGTIELGVDVVLPARFDDEIPERIGPFRAILTWNPTQPDGVSGELVGSPELAPSLHPSIGEFRLEGRHNGCDVEVVEANIRMCYESKSHEHGPRLLATFIASTLRVSSGRQMAGPAVDVAVSYFVEPDPVWSGFFPLFHFEDKLLEPTVALDIYVDEMRIQTSYMLFRGPAPLISGDAIAQRIAGCIRVSSSESKTSGDLDSFLQQAAAIVDDVLLAASLVPDGHYTRSVAWLPDQSGPAP